ncbi:hypothetical protein [Lysobacter claricitrinus]|uniref:hypothetical protein n=1 Tax=Lysobacter claricitrinus TaxID=3367728 RepID=UPI0037DAEEB9
MSAAGATDGRSRRRRWRRWAVAALALGAYPAFVLGATYVHFFQAHLPGGRNGPADAYRHSLASAIVAYTLSPRCVDWVTHVMEHDGVGNDGRAMDAHNNLLGARIGSAARSWSDMQAAIRDAVRNGAVDANDPDRITWLPPSRWQNRLY